CTLTTLPIISSKKKPAPHGKLPAIPPLAEDEEQRYRPIDRTLLRRVLGLLAPYKRQYALGVSLGVAMTILDMLSPKFMQWLIDFGVSYQKSALVPQPSEGGAIRHVLF